METTELEALKLQQTTIQEQIVSIDQGEKIGDRQALQDELNAIGNKISELEYAARLEAQTAQIEAQHETLVEQTKAKTAYLLDTLEIEGLSISQLSASEEAYDILRQGLQQFIDEKDATMLNQLKAVKEESAKAIADLKFDQIALVKQLEDKEIQLSNLRNDISSAFNEIEDLSSKRDAAVNELEESKQEVERLNSQVQDLRTEIAIGAKAATQIVSNDDDLKAKAEAYKQSIFNSKPVIYNLRWDEETKPANSVYLAELVSTGETIRFPWTQKTKYREVTAEQAETFRNEQAAQQAETEVDTNSSGPVAVEEQPVTAPQFQDEETTEPGVVEENTSVEVAGQAVTRYEFNELIQEVEYIKEQLIKSGINL